MQNRNSGVDLPKEALFESLRHPTRISILKAINSASLNFSEIKRKVMIEQWPPDISP